jgi:hypothetical protein
MTETRPTVAVPRSCVAQLLATIVNQYQQRGGHYYPDPETGPAIRAVYDAFARSPEFDPFTSDKIIIAAAPDHVPDPSDTITLDAEQLWWVHDASHALDTNYLDETDDASYQHPAVQAELDVQCALMDQAPEVFDRLAGLTYTRMRDRAHAHDRLLEELESPDAQANRS